MLLSILTVFVVFLRVARVGVRLIILRDHFMQEFRASFVRELAFPLFTALTLRLIWSIILIFIANVHTYRTVSTMRMQLKQKLSHEIKQRMSILI